VQDTKLFETILGIQAPWRISRVVLDTSAERIDLSAEHASDTRLAVSGVPARAAVSGSCRRTCVAAPRYVSVTDVPPRPHGVRQVRASWAQVRSRFTLLMERLIIDLIQQYSTVIGACRIARITSDEAWGVMTRAFARGRARKVAQPIPYIGVDEKAFRKGHRYHTIV
jgi:transposase